MLILLDCMMSQRCSSSLEGQHYYSFKIEKRDQDPTSIINHNIHRGPLDDETYERYVRSDPCTDFQSASEVNWSPGAMLWASSRGDCFQNDQIKADPTGQNYQFGYFKMCDGKCEITTAQRSIITRLSRTLMGCTGPSRNGSGRTAHPISVPLGAH